MGLENSDSDEEEILQRIEEARKRNLEEVELLIKGKKVTIKLKKITPEMVSGELVT